MLNSIDYEVVVFVWLARAVTALVLYLKESILVVDPAVCRHVLQCEVVRDELVVRK